MKYFLIALLIIIFPEVIIIPFLFGYLFLEFILRLFGKSFEGLNKTKKNKMKRVKIGDYFYNPKNLDWLGSRRKESSGVGMGKRFYTALDMAIIKRDAAHRNGQIKRGEVQRHGNEYISVCGCGSEGCFVHCGYDNVPKERRDK